MVEVNLNPFQIEIAPVEEGDEELKLITVVGTMVPGPGGQAMALPTALVRFTLNRESAVAIGREGEKLKKPSEIAVASSLSGVDQALRSDRNLRGG